MAHGTLELLKYLALLLMTLDHVNKFLFHASLPWLYEAGRAAMPIFAFALASNLARDSALRNGVHVRVMLRLLGFGSLASLFFVPMAGWLPLNILFTLLAATLSITLLEQPGTGNRMLAGAIFLSAGFLVEFGWFGLGYCLAAWWFCKSPSLARGLLWGCATASLSIVNDNLWALAALPVIALARPLNIELPRIRHLFYAYYPAHLAALLALQQFMPRT